MGQYSLHAQGRMRQRGFRKEAVRLMLANGISVRSQGAIIYRYHRRKINKGESPAIPPCLRDKLANFPYIVVSNNDDIITVGYRRARIKRDTKPYQQARRHSRRKT